MVCAESGLEVFGLLVAALALFTAGRIFGARE